MRVAQLGEERNNFCVTMLVRGWSILQKCISARWESYNLIRSAVVIHLHFCIMHVALPEEIFGLVRYLNWDASSSRPSQPTRSLTLKFEGERFIRKQDHSSEVGGGRDEIGRFEHESVILMYWVTSILEGLFHFPVRDHGRKWRIAINELWQVWTKFFVGQRGSHWVAFPT